MSALARLRPAAATAGRWLRADAPRSVTWLYIATLCLIYCFVSVHTPMTLGPDAPHDDGAYMKLGRYIAEGMWLGPFDQFTLMKGPGYPLFLAASSWLGVPVSLGHALFHCFTITFFVVVCHRFVRSAALSGLMFTLLLWQPLPLTVYLRRILREQIYYGQLLLLLSLLVLLLFTAQTSRRRFFYAALSGLVLGWCLLTREEGPILLPAILLLIGAGAYHAYRFRLIRQFAASVTVVAVAFAASQVGYRALNWRYYGSFAGVDFKESNYQKALGALSSVRSGGIKPFIPVTRATRQLIYSVSPAFRSLKPYFDPDNEPPPRPEVGGWVGATCGLLPQACGEIAGGWFVWALRDAASRYGHYASPASSSAFYAQLAFEINAACTRGDLECKPQLFPEMPPVIWSEAAVRMLSSLRTAFNYLTIEYATAVRLNDSVGFDASFPLALRFLNYPYHLPPVTMRQLSEYLINGWYYKKGAEWFSISAKLADGTPVGTYVQRVGSADISVGRKDPLATNQRFAIRLRCTDNCTVTFHLDDGVEYSRPLSELRRGLTAFESGPAVLALENTTEYPNALTIQSKPERTAQKLRAFMVSYYNILYLPTFALGAFAFLFVTVVYWRVVVRRVTYILAFTAWALVITRVLLLSLIDATTFPAVQVPYLAPSQFLIVCAAVLSLAAWLELSGCGAPTRSYARGAVPA